MPDTNNLINQIVGLDFDEIKINLQNYLKSQDTFKDYNFEGSNLSQLLNILAYNTHYDAFLLNMQASEMTLQNTTKRISTVDRAKQIGYIPRSTRSSSTIIDLEIIPTDNTVNSVVLPTGFALQTSILGKSYIFSTQSDNIVQKNAQGRFIFNNIEFVEGRKFTHKFLINSSNIRGITIPNKNVDTSRLLINVKPSSSSQNAVTYLPVSSIVTLNSNSLVYFVQETDQQKHQIYFGDDNTGKALNIGNQVIIDYLVSAGNAANSASVFEASTSIQEFSSVIIISATPSSGGADIESIDSIKVSAPLAYQSQDRAVSYIDYDNVVRKVFPDIESLSVWGGEDNDPIALGYAFLCIKPFNRNYLSEPEKVNIEAALKNNYSIIGIEPVITDPNYLFVRIDSTIKYVNSSNTSGLIDTVKNAILNYSSTELNKFNQTFRYSVLIRAIDNSSSVITNNLTIISLRSEKILSSGVVNLVRMNFSQAIKPEVFSSDIFTARVGGILYPNSNYVGRLNNTIDLVYFVSGVETVIVANVGQIRFDGIITLTNYSFSETGSTIVPLGFTAVPSVNDITPTRNTLIQIRSSDISVNLIPNK